MYSKFNTVGVSTVLMLLLAYKRFSVIKNTIKWECVYNVSINFFNINISLIFLFEFTFNVLSKYSRQFGKSRVVTKKHYNEMGSCNFLYVLLFIPAFLLDIFTAPWFINNDFVITITSTSLKMLSRVTVG